MRATMFKQISISIGTIVVSVALVSVLQGAQQKGRSKSRVPAGVEAQQFILRDETGKMVARLFAAEGGPQLSMYDKDGKPKLVLMLDGGLPTIMMGGADDAKKIALMSTAKGAVVVTVEGGKDGNLTLGAADGEQVHLTIYDANKKQIFQAP
jgi:hypothetical protein